MKLSDYVVDFLVSRKVSHVFEVCGGSITHILDSLHGRKDITAISMHHEQASSFAAEGYARSCSRVGVAIATSGPGATNMITGIASSYFDSVPCVFITGQVNTYEFKFEKPVRQAGFQETDIVNIVKPIVKDASIVTSPEKIKYHLEKAFYIAGSGRPGPVLLDIPMDVQRAQIEPLTLKGFVPNAKRKKPIDKAIDRAVRLIEKSSRPVILAGGGIRVSLAKKELGLFVRNTGIPVVVSLMGLDALEHNSRFYVGLIGTYGNRYANLALANADLVIAVGTRLDTRQTGTKPGAFSRGAKIIHVDIDPNELNHKVKSELPICSDAKYFLSLMNAAISKRRKAAFSAWLNRIESYKDKFSGEGPEGSGCISPKKFIEAVSDNLASDCIVFADVGQNQMWSAQYLDIKRNQRYITQGGMAAMGSALSMAIGSSFACARRPVVVITGDGGFQLNIQELQTLAHYNLPIKIILLNNRCYGMVRQFQKQYFGSRFQSTVIGYSSPDFVKVVSAYKIPSALITKPKEIPEALKNIFKTAGPSFLEVNIAQDALVTPKLSVNKPIEDQEPYLPREELKRLMLIDVHEEGCRCARAK